MSISNPFYSKVSLSKRRYSRIKIVTRPLRYTRWNYPYLPGIAKILNVAVVQSGADAEVTWTPRSADFTNYYVYRSTDAENYTLVGTVTDESVGSFTDVDPGEDFYYYYVVGDNLSGAISPESD